MTQQERSQEHPLTPKRSLRPDTTLAPAGKPEDEVYVRALPVCCLSALKAAVVRRSEEERRSLELSCRCGRSWWVTSSLDGRVLERFVTHGGPQVSGGYGPSAA